jgi:tetratricopeptide (TPR) repeat protein
LHNLGLIYFETENYQNAAAAFEQALNLKKSLPHDISLTQKSRKKWEMKSDDSRTRERAVEIEPNHESYTSAQRKVMKQ